MINKIKFKREKKRRKRNNIKQYKGKKTKKWQIEGKRTKQKKLYIKKEQNITKPLKENIKFKLNGTKQN